MVALGASASHDSPDSNLSNGTMLGKRYVDDASGIEVLCTKAGVGTITFDGRTLLLKEAKPLPSSD